MQDVYDILETEAAFCRRSDFSNKFSGHGSFKSNRFGESISDFWEECVVGGEVDASDVGDVSSGGEVDVRTFDYGKNAHLATPIRLHLAVELIHLSDQVVINDRVSHAEGGSGFEIDSFADCHAELVDAQCSATLECSQREVTEVDDAARGSTGAFESDLNVAGPYENGCSDRSAVAPVQTR